MTGNLTTDALMIDLAGFASTMAVAMAAVFGFAAAIKLKSPTVAVTQFTELGVPRPRLMARVVPVFELVIAFALLVAPPVGGLAAMMLLVAFTAVITAAVRHGNTAACGCFGAMSQKPIGRATALRNLLFIAMSATATATPALVMPSIATVAAASLLLLIVALAAQLISLRKTLGRIWSVELAGEATRAGPKPGFETPSSNKTIGGMTA